MRWFDKKGPDIPASTEADSLRTQLAIERTRYAGELSRLTNEANALRDQLDEFKRERMLRRARELIGIKEPEKPEDRIADALVTAYNEGRASIYRPNPYNSQLWLR